MKSDSVFSQPQRFDHKHFHFYQNAKLSLTLQYNLF